MPLTTETGHEFANAEVAVEFIRECQDKILHSHGEGLPEITMAVVEMTYTFHALDNYLTRGGTLPIGWARAGRPGARAQ